MARQSIIVIGLVDRAPSQRCLTRMARDVFGADDWDMLMPGIGPKGDLAFLQQRHSEFASRVYSAMLTIIEEMRDRDAAQLLEGIDAEGVEGVEGES